MARRRAAAPIGRGEVGGLRIVGGEAGGRRIRVPRGATVRPTAGRVRGALFAILGERVRGAEVLDLFAGSGGLGLEALSRGARSCLFVDRDAACVAAVRDNAADLGFSGRAEARRGDALATARALRAEGRSFDVVLLDPPYRAAPWDEILGLLAGGLLRPGGVAVAEHAAGEAVPEVPGLAVLDRRRYGDTVLTFLACVDEGGRRPRAEADGPQRPLAEAHAPPGGPDSPLAEADARPAEVSPPRRRM